MIFLKSKSNLVTIQIDKKWRYVNTQEQEIMKELLEGIIKLLKAQINGGNSVIQVYETYTTPMFQIVSLLRNIYNEVDLVHCKFTVRTMPKGGRMYFRAYLKYNCNRIKLAVKKKCV